jgi:MarR family transcriptional regulator, organic hydroperoxide resistance regulator
MPSALQRELKMTRPFASRAQEAHLGIARTAAVLDHAVDEAFRAERITATQFNVLRILRGAGDTGLCRAEIGVRMIRRVPDVTRLIDRLEEAGLVRRDREDHDRRYVTTRITRKGLALLDGLDARVNALHDSLLGHLGEARLRRLIELLDVVREGQSAP